MRNKALLTVEQYQMLPAGSRVTVALRIRWRFFIFSVRCVKSIG